MTKDRMATLVRLLHERTQEGTVFWENTEREGVFEAAFEQYALRTSVRQHGDSEAQEDFCIGIYQRGGALLDEFDDRTIESDLGDAHQRMKEIYVIARRNALGVDNAVEHIITQLSEN